MGLSEESTGKAEPQAKHSLISIVQRRSFLFWNSAWKEFGARKVLSRSMIRYSLKMSRSGDNVNQNLL